MFPICCLNEIFSLLKSVKRILKHCLTDPVGVVIAVPEKFKFNTASAHIKKKERKEEKSGELQKQTWWFILRCISAATMHIFERALKV